MWEDYNVDDVLYVLDNPQKRCANIAGAIPTRSRIIVDIRDEKHGMVIKKPVSDWSLFARQKVYPRLRDKCYENDEYEKRYWWNRNVIKDDYYWAKKIADKCQGWCMCIKIPASNEKCVELLIIDNIWMKFRDRDLALKLFFNRCDEECFECEQCTFANNEKVLERYDILDMSRCCNVCERVTCKCSVEECDMI